MRNISNLVLEDGVACAIPAGAKVISNKFARALAKLHTVIMREVPEGYQDQTGFHFAGDAFRDVPHASQPIGFEYYLDLAEKNEAPSFWPTSARDGKLT